MKVFNDIDAYFEKKDKKEFYYALVGIVLLVGFLFIYYLYPIATNYQKTNIQRFNNIKRDLRNEISALNSLKKDNERLINNLKIETNKLISFKKQESFYSQLVSVLDFATFNRYKWANFIKNIINDANNEGLKVISIDNKIIPIDNNSSKKIVKYLIIDMEVKGRYKNFIHYIYQYEKLKDLIRIEKMGINSDDTYKVEINVYGYRQ